MSLFALMVGIGILLVYILGAFLDWRIVASVPTILMYTLLCVALIFIPESPVWLLGHKGVGEGKEALQWLRNGADVEEELEIMKATMEKQSHGLTMTEALKNLSEICEDTIPYYHLKLHFHLVVRPICCDLLCC